MYRNPTLSVLACLCSVALFSNSAKADNEKGTAVIKGKVVYNGEAPETKKLPPMNAMKVCHDAHPKGEYDQATIVYKNNGNTIPFVFVYAKSGVKGKYDPPKNPVLIDQKGCMYHPHVLGMVAGQEINIKNSDPENHNINSRAQKNPTFNVAQSQKGMVKVLQGSETFNKPEIMAKVVCNVHSWMSCFINVCSHPFFDVTKSHYEFPSKVDDKEAPENKAKWGTFEIKDLPAGEYDVEAVHEAFGKTTQKIRVKDGETKEIEFKLGPAK